jgi:photosystem II stability/assembly factor-like uncharacterized protein
MNEYRDLLEQERRRHAMRDGTVRGLERRRNRKRRNGQIVAGIVALLIAAAGVGGGLYAFRSSAARKPIVGHTPTPSPTTSLRPSPTPSPVPGTQVAAASRVSGPLQFVDDRQGWAVVEGHILVTSDGGKTWTPQYMGSEVTGVTFIDPDHGWATSVGGLLRTVDGGGHWSSVGQSGVSFAEIQFQDAQVGWGIREDLGKDSPFAGTLVGTSDGGQTWVARGYQADSICFSSDGRIRNVWAASPGEPGVQLIRSQDGGSSWVAVTDIPLEPAEQPWSVTVRCTGGDAWLMIRDGGAAGHVAYAVFESTNDPAGSLIMQEGGTRPLGHREGVYESEDPYPGPFTVVSPGAATFLNWCPACGGSLASVSITITAGQPAAVTDRFPVVTGNVNGEPIGVSFLPPVNGEGVHPHGWALLKVSGDSGPRTVILETLDGGRTWAPPCGDQTPSCFPQ